MASLLNMSGGSLLKKGLPYDAEIEYLQSTGTQYIDTGFKHSNNTRFVTKMSFVSISTWLYPFGSYGNPRNVVALFCFEIDGGRSLSSYYGSSATKKFGDVRVDTIYDIDFNKNIHTINNYTNTYSEETFNSVYNDLIFASTNYQGGISGKGAYRFYFFKIYDNDVLVRDFIPVRVGTTGYMYDKVSGQLFGNAGTGEFILGPDK